MTEDWVSRWRRVVIASMLELLELVAAYVGVIAIPSASTVATCVVDDESLFHVSGNLAGGNDLAFHGRSRRS